jgi:hypothetical protein
MPQAQYVSSSPRTRRRQSSSPKKSHGGLMDGTWGFNKCIVHYFDSLLPFTTKKKHAPRLYVPVNRIHIIIIIIIIMKDGLTYVRTFSSISIGSLYGRGTLCVLSSIHPLPHDDSSRTGCTNINQRKRRKPKDKKPIAIQWNGGKRVDSQSIDASLSNSRTLSISPTHMWWRSA